MADATRRVSVRLSLDDAARVKAELREVGETGQRSLDQIKGGAERASRSLDLLDVATRGIQLAGVAVAARALVQAGDALTQSLSRLQSATGSVERAGQVYEALRVLAGSRWEEGFVGQWLDVLEDTVLAPRDVKVPLGLKMHVVDVWVDELEKVDEKKEAPGEKLLGPLRKLASDSVVKSVRNKVKEALGDDRLEEWGIVIEKQTQEEQTAGQMDGETEDGGEWTGFDDEDE